MTRIGFTGTQHGMTIEQGRVVLDLLKQLEATEFHHGCCIGADKQAHMIAHALSIPIILWPPINTAKMAFDCLKTATKLQPADEYLLRNHKIAFFSEKLIACPRSMEEEVRSGTWATIRYARKLKRHIYIVLPKGDVREENAS